MQRRRGACVCRLCGPTDNCRGKHSWWKAISQIILATIRECGGVKWRFHMQMRRWERSGTLPNSYDPHAAALWCASPAPETHKETACTLLWGRREQWIKSSINHVKCEQQRVFPYVVFLLWILPLLFLFLSEAASGIFFKYDNLFHGHLPFIPYSIIVCSSFVLQLLVITPSEKMSYKGTEKSKSIKCRIFDTS